MSSAMWAECLTQRTADSTITRNRSPLTGGKTRTRRRQKATLKLNRKKESQPQSSVPLAWSTSTTVEKWLRPCASHSMISILMKSRLKNFTKRSISLLSWKSTLSTTVLIKRSQRSTTSPLTFLVELETTTLLGMLQVMLSTHNIPSSKKRWKLQNRHLSTSSMAKSWSSCRLRPLCAKLGTIGRHSTRVGSFSGLRSPAHGKSISTESKRRQRWRSRSSSLSTRMAEACTGFKLSPRVLPALRTGFPFARPTEGSEVVHSTRQVDLQTVNSCMQQALLEVHGVLKALLKWLRHPWQSITSCKRSS